MRNEDVFFDRPDEVLVRFCRVCGTRCQVERGRLAPTSWSAAMARKSTLHDFFSCPHREEHWHQQAEELVKQIKHTPSKRLAELMRLDLQDLLREHLGENREQPDPPRDEP